jgi:hypothetical protein
MEKELTEYYRDYVLPMSLAQYPLSFDRYVAPPTLYKRFANQMLERVNRQLQPLIMNWEETYHQHFFVLGERYLDVMVGFFSCFCSFVRHVRVCPNTCALKLACRSTFANVSFSFWRALSSTASGCMEKPGFYSNSNFN